MGCIARTSVGSVEQALLALLANKRSVSIIMGPSITADCGQKYHGRDIQKSGWFAQVGPKYFLRPYGLPVIWRLAKRMAMYFSIGLQCFLWRYARSFLYGEVKFFTLRAYPTSGIYK